MHMARTTRGSDRREEQDCELRLEYKSQNYFPASSDHKKSVRMDRTHIVFGTLICLLFSVLQGTVGE